MDKRGWTAVLVAALLLVVAVPGVGGGSASAGVSVDEPRVMDAPGPGRYRLFGTKWPRLDLTYGFVNYSPDLTPAAQRQIVAQAFRAWADVSSLRFRRVADCGRPLDHPACQRPDIRIRFVPGPTFLAAPGIRIPWGGAIGYAFGPPSANPFPDSSIPGDIQLRDGGTDWSVDDSAGDSWPLVVTTLHEIGHSLGLDHTQDSRCGAPAPDRPLMCWGNFADQDHLAADDIHGVRRLYGNFR